MPVLVYGGSRPVVRLKIAYVGWPGAGVRTNLEALASRRETLDRPRVVTGEDGAPLQYFVNLRIDDAAGCERLTRANAELHVYLSGAAAVDAESPHLLDAVEWADAVVVVMRSCIAGVGESTSAFGRCLVALIGSGADLTTMPIVLQCNRRDEAELAPPEIILDEMQRFFTKVTNHARGMPLLSRWFGKRSSGCIETTLATASQGEGVEETLDRAVAAALASARVQRCMEPLSASRAV
jgi:hypothetical protein